MNPCDYFLWKYIKDHVYHSNWHAIKETKAETEAAAAEEITADKLHDTVDNFMVHL